MALIFVPTVYFNAIVIKIDIPNKTISFKNIFLHKTRTYDLTKIDGYVDTIWRDGYFNTYDIIHLILQYMLKYLFIG